MNEVNKTLYIPLYGKSFVSKKGIILHDAKAEEIWAKEEFELKGKSKSKWLAYNMAMRARVFDDWTDQELKKDPDAIVLHIGCGMDSRCLRVKQPYSCWYDCDFPEGNTVIVVLEGISMYLTNDQLKALIAALRQKYLYVHVLIDVYTQFGARASEKKNPINDVGVTKVYGVDDIDAICEGTGVMKIAEHSFTPKHLIDELKPIERGFFKMLFTGKTYGRIYRLFELKSI